MTLAGCLLSRFVFGKNCRCLLQLSTPFTVPFSIKASYRRMNHAFLNVNKDKDQFEWKPKSIKHPESRFAVLLLNCESGRSTDDDETSSSKLVFHDLWTRANVRVSVDGGTNRLPKDSSILPPDIIAGDFDSTNEETLEYFRSKGSLVIATPDQDETDFTKALQIVLNHQKEGKIDVLDVIIAISRIGGRPDHILSNFHTLHRFVNETSIPILLYDIGSSMSWVLRSGITHEIQTDWESTTSTENRDSSTITNWCALVPLSGDAILTTKGLRWNLNESTLKFGSFISTSNEFDPKSNIVEVTSNRNILWSMKDPLLH